MVNIEFNFPKQRKESLTRLLCSIRNYYPKCEIIVERYYSRMNDTIIVSGDLNADEVTHIHDFVGFHLEKICLGR